MLPENEFHSAPTESPKKNRSKFYTTQQVLEKTLMSRFTLIRKTKEGVFPSPVNPGSSGQNFYVKEEVDEWIAKNAQWVNFNERNKYVLHTIQFERYQSLQIERASSLLECDINKFINDAALWKAQLILNQAEREQNTSEYLD
tara:strand:+ start:211 stop:639 length:429 start_codon:yes stop_codon:yes gene_type:complete